MMLSRTIIISDTGMIDGQIHELGELVLRDLPPGIIERGMELSVFPTSPATSINYVMNQFKLDVVPVVRDYGFPGAELDGAVAVPNGNPARERSMRPGVQQADIEAGLTAYARRSDFGPLCCADLSSMVYGENYPRMRAGRTVKEALDLMDGYGIDAMPLVENDGATYIGMLRKDMLGAHTLNATFADFVREMTSFRRSPSYSRG